MANSLDVVLVQPELSVGGTERVILEIAKKFNPVIYAMNYRKHGTFREFSEFDIRSLGGSFLEAPAGAFSAMDGDGRMKTAALAGFRFLGMKIKDDYDVINPHLMPSEWIANRNSRVCWYCHSPCRPAYGWTDEFMRERGILGKAALGTAIAAYRIVEGMVVPKISSICANSRFTRQNIAKYLKRDDATVAHPAVETADFDCKGYEKFFFYPSRIVPEKRLEYAIEAFKKSKLGGKGWKLRIGGHLVPSKRNLAYMEMLKSAAKGGGVEFELNMDEKRLRGAYADCYSTVFCGKREDWGIVPLESMASKKPCISVNEGGPRESILDGKTGFLVNSAEQMAEKMEFLAGHRDECEKMGRAGRKRAEQNYTWKIFLSKMDKAFRETAKGKDGS